MGKRIVLEGGTFVLAIIFLLLLVKHMKANWMAKIENILLNTTLLTFLSKYLTIVYHSIC